MKLPVLFLGHGSPMNAIEETVYSQSWQALGMELKEKYGDEIKAILSISAHWCTRGSAVTINTKPKTIHDFGGFPQALHDMQYPALGSPELAQKVRQLLGEEIVLADESWGLDHGTWGVLCQVFPKADIPIVQLSLDVGLNFAGHFSLGKKLAVLREQGVLIVASGNIVHNLRMMDRLEMDKAGVGYPWAEEIKKLINTWLIENNMTALSSEEAYPDSFYLAAPTPEHYWPLLYVSAAADGDKAVIFNDDLVGKSLSMTSVIWQ